MSPQCLITGADLVIEAENKRVHGDLHEIGDVWIFNAVLKEYGKTAWVYGEPLASSYAWRLLCVTGGYFERRGVIVIPKSEGYLNPEAERYINAALT